MVNKGEFMVYGYMGSILRVDLTKGTIKEQSFDEDTLKKYLGGSGLGVKILFEETNAKTDPLEPENLLIFMTGPLVGTPALSFGRHQAITRSPLTNSYGEGNAGGTWGVKLKRAGFDGIVVTGKAPKPVYIYIEDGKAQILDASDLWGKDTYQVDDIQKNTHGDKTITASIGQAGENLVRFAAIMNDGADGRTTARCGLGAVMGSKNLKAISLNGNRRPALARENEMMQSVKEWSKKVRTTLKEFSKYGTTMGMETVEAIGDLPIKNWSAGNFDVENITGQTMAETILVRNYYCAQCVIGCGRTIEIKEGKYKCVRGGGPEYETMGMLGSNCMINDLSAIAYGNELCNRYGLDTISTGSTVSFVMEAYENGVITKEMLGGIEAKWGNSDAMIEIIKKIAFREGIGNILAEGTKRAAGLIGGLAPEFAVHVRGLEFPAHDPRAANSVGLQYATSTRGACHVNAYIHDFETAGSFPGFGYYKKMDLDRFSTEGKEEFTKVTQDFMALCDSFICCKFIIFGLGDDTFRLITEWLNSATGWSISEEDLLKTGERIFNLKRMYLIRDGQSRKDDVLPPKMRKRRGTGGSANHIPEVDGMIDEYYELRGWNEYGIPTEKLLDELDLGFTKV